MTTPDYNWNCAVCNQTNLSGDNQCVDCKAPCNLTFDQIVLRKENQLLTNPDNPNHRPLLIKVAVVFLLLPSFFSLLLHLVDPIPSESYTGRLLSLLFYLAFAWGFWHRNRWATSIYLGLSLLSFGVAFFIDLDYLFNLLFSFAGLTNIIIIVILLSPKVRIWLLS